MPNEVTIAYAIIIAIVYSLVFFAKKKLNKETPQEFDPIKFTSTLVVGAAIGVAFYLGDIAITAEAIEAQLLAYGTVIWVVESIVKIIVRALRHRATPVPT